MGPTAPRAKTYDRVTLSIDGAAVTIQQQDDDIKALRAVLSG